MSKLVGFMEPFIPGGNFAAYEYRLEQFFKINDISEEAKTPLFITIAGPEICELLMSLTVPDLPSDREYKELITALRTHFCPKKNKRAERYKFYQLRQQEGEPLNDFIVRLKSLSQSCLFGDFIDTTKVASGGELKLKCLDEALTDRFIVGLINDRVRQALLSDDSLNFDQCCNKALNIEMSERESKAIQQPHQASVLAVGSQGHSRSNQGHSQANQGQGQVRKQSQNQHNSSNSPTPCRRCGRKHNGKTCPAANWECFICRKVGHTSRVCFHRNSNISNITNESDPESAVMSVTSINNIIGQNLPSMCCVEVEGVPLEMEIDTGACATIMSHHEYLDKFCYLKLSSLSLNLTSVTGNKIVIMGKITVGLSIGCKSLKMDIIIVEGDKPSRALMGRNWLDTLFPKWRTEFSGCESIKSVSLQNNVLNEIKLKYPNVIEKRLNCPIIGYNAEIQLKPNQKPIFHCAYSVPFRLRDKVNDELTRLENEKIIMPVKNSNWASPIVIVPKSNGQIRICMDCKVTINKCIMTEHYPLPRIDDIFANLAGCNYFCVLDLTGAYQQIPVSETSQELLTINTQKGLFRFTRLCFGVSSAPSIFQSVMDRILINISGAHCYLDDIIIGAPTPHLCRERLFQVLERLNVHNVRINLDKCKFIQSEVSYLGHVLSNGKISPNPNKVKAIVDAPVPKDLPQLQSYLGLINYYGRFLPNLSMELKDLYALLAKEKKFIWSPDCQQAFVKSKELIEKNSILELYDPGKPIIIATDASPYGVGAIMSHIVDGVEKPVLFASSSLSPAERNYSQLHREALAIIFALKKFNKYIYGQKFTIYTDNQAIKEIFNPNKGTPPVAAARLQRWSIILSTYDYDIKYRRGLDMGNVDALSRLPLEEETGIDAVCISYFNNSTELPVDGTTIQKSSKQDPILSKVYGYILDGWPKSKLPNDFTIYFKNRNLLNTENKLMYYGHRVVIPKVLQKSVLMSLHENHTGIVRMKMLNRSYAWWPNCDKDIENYVQSCNICQGTQNVPKEIVTTNWPQCSYPLERIHVDFFYYFGKTFLIIVDSYSKFCDIKLMPSTNINTLIDKLKSFFSIFGLPVEIVSDNGPPFQSFVFKTFCKLHGIILSKSPPYHPQSNGLAERAVQSVKRVFRKFCLEANEGMSIQNKIEKFLIHQRNSICTTTSKTPAELIFSYKPRILLDLLNNNKNIENLSGKEKEKPIVKMKFAPNNNNFKSKYFVGENVLYRNHFKNLLNWIPAVVLKCLSNLTYLINVSGRVRFVHDNQIKKSNLNKKYFPQPIFVESDLGIGQEESDFSMSPESPNAEIDLELRRSVRNRRAPKRFTFSEFD